MMEELVMNFEMSKKVLDSSAIFMKFMVQDLLDFAMIKAEKF
jgi:hypothetical protein